MDKSLKRKNYLAHPKDHKADGALTRNPAMEVSTSLDVYNSDDRRIMNQNDLKAVAIPKRPFQIVNSDVYNSGNIQAFEKLCIWPQQLPTYTAPLQILGAVKLIGPLLIYIYICIYI